MNINEFLVCLEHAQIDFFTGVPDSLLQPLCDELIDRYKDNPQHHIIAHNEGGCLGIAAGYYMATKKVPCVYLQNSGIGNLINPYASLSHPLVYGVPTLFIVGWRGQPGVADEPQHLFQGQITISLLEGLGIKHYILKKDSDQTELQSWLQQSNAAFAEGKSVALIVEKGALTIQKKCSYANLNSLSREKALQCILEQAPNAVFVSTTGKLSRELFELREKMGQEHHRDFLTVGSMGHCSMIALGVALQKPTQQIWCLDGDGAALMHMGSMALIAKLRPRNFFHVIFNNNSHESVGGAPIANPELDFCSIVMACGYKAAFTASDERECIINAKHMQQMHGPILLQIKVANGARTNLGRPSTTPIENLKQFMECLERE